MKKQRLFILFILLITYISCSDNDSKPAPLENLDFTYSDKIDQFYLESNLEKIANPALYTIKWTTDSELVNITETSSKVYFKLPDISKPEYIDITLTVTSDDGWASATRSILLPELTESRKIGLGANQQSVKNNDVDYDWYYDQGNSGKFSTINCGPASVTMAIKWVNKDFEKNPEDARNTYRPEGGWWYTDDIMNYLSLHNVNHHVIDVTNIQAINSLIDENNIVLLCLDMYYIRNETNNQWHVDKFYTANTKEWGHFLVVKGYTVVDNTVFYEVYDPYSFNVKYINGEYKGKNRFYRSVDLENAVVNWWRYAIIVSNNNQQKSAHAVDINSIEHKPGR